MGSRFYSLIAGDFLKPRHHCKVEMVLVVVILMIMVVVMRKKMMMMWW